MKSNLKDFGQKLKTYRQQAGMQLEDMAAAIESDPTTVAKMESGEQEVDEEVLTLLTSLFKLDEEQSLELWQMALSEDQIIKLEGSENMQDDNKEQEIKVNLPADVKVLYTDMIQIQTSPYGITLHFMQSAPGNNAQVVSRVGMSREHAQSLVDMLAKNIEASE